MEALRRAFREKGYVHGQNLVFDYRAADGESERFPLLAGQLVDAKVNVIITTTALGVQAAKQATTLIPIVVAGVDDAVEQRFVDSLARPGAKLTGISWLNTELSAKRLQLLREIDPSGSPKAFLREGVGGITQLRATEAAARTLGIRLRVMEVLDRSWLPNTFLQMRRDGVSAVVVADSPMFNIEQKQIAELAIANQLPTIFPSATFVRAGGLISYGPNLADVYARSVDYADRILKGAKPADLPVEQPTKIELVINLKTAKALEFDNSPSVIHACQRGDRIGAGP